MAETLYIIDGHAHLYASYHAIRALSSPSGEPTNAVYGVTSVLMKVLRERQPAYLVVAFDPPGPVFRHQLYDQYKANRPEMPQDLRVQSQRIRDVCAAMGIAVLCEEGFEADDVIATVTRLGRDRGVDIVICSKDKDLQQLLGDGVVMYDTKSDIVTDAATLEGDKGIKPTQVVDMLALMGDTSDNVPGVAGIGPKTAAKLISEYGSLDELLARRDTLQGRNKQRLAAADEQLRLSRELVQLRYDVPVEPDWNAWRASDIDYDSVAELFQELGFTRFLNQLRPEGTINPAGSAANDDGGSVPMTPASSSDRVRSSRQDSSAGAGAGDPMLSGGLFGSLTPEQPVVAVADECEYVLVNTDVKFEQFMRDLSAQPAFAIDTETTSLQAVDADLVGLCFSWQAGSGYYIPVRGRGGMVLDEATVLDALRGVCADEKILKVGQNLKYDLVVLAGAGVQLAGPMFDTMLASYILDASRPSHGMDALAEEVLGYTTIKIEQLIGKRGKSQLRMDELDPSAVCGYAAEDADITWRLYEVFDRQLQTAGLTGLFADLEMPLMLVLADMERRGVSVDTHALATMSNELADRIRQLDRQIVSAAGREFNPDSPKQVADVLFDELKLPANKKTKTGRSTDISVLEDLRGTHEIVEYLIEYRQLTKLKSTYIDTLPEMISDRTGRLHASFMQAVTETGRLSSRDPNLQNIPIRTEIGRQIRGAFVPGKAGEVILAADYSQVELRMLAHFCEDEQLRAAFEDDRDIHAFVAAQIFGVDLADVTDEQRRRAKTVNFGIIYGQTPFGLSRTLGISREQAREFMDAYFLQYPRIREFLAECVEQARRQGFVQTILGRRRRIPDIDSSNHNRRSFAERTAVNTVVQGSAADLIKQAMVNIHRRVHEQSLPLQMLIQVHDELVFETPAFEAERMAAVVTEEMTQAMDLAVPLKVDVAWGENWLASK